MVQDVWRRRDLGVAYQDECIRIDVIYRQEDRYASTARVCGCSLTVRSSSAFRSPHWALQDTLANE
jgi:hypothetical protein